MAHRKPKADVEYYTEKQNKIGVLHNYYGDIVDFYYKHKPIAYSTKATSDLLSILKRQSTSWEDLLSKINYDEDAKAVVKAYIDKKSDFNKVLFG